MQTLATILSFTSGFALMGYRETHTTMIATSLVVDASLAPLTAIIASRRGRSATRWTILGLMFGMWTLAYVLLTQPRPKAGTGRPDEPFPPASDAA